MGQQYTELTDELQTFIHAQKMFFVATAGAEGRINLSPKGLDSMRVIDGHRLAWLNLTGSGNETAAHVLENGRMTMMFCAFDGKPLILRVYVRAKAVHPRDANWNELAALFPPRAGMRQVFDCHVESALSSCGWGVPVYEFAGERPLLEEWSQKKGPEGITEYWDKKNKTSIDGKPTNIFPSQA